MLMSHRTGIPEHVLLPEFLGDVRKQPDKIWKGKELVAYILDKEPLFPAGEKFAYADTNYILVGMIIERITRNDFYTELEQRILQPLKLESTVPQVHRANTECCRGLFRTGRAFRVSREGYRRRPLRR